MIRDIAYRIDVLRRGSYLTTLRWDASEAPNVYFSSEAPIHGSLSGTFIRDSSIDPLSDELQPIINIDGLDYPLGIYRIASNLSIFSSSGKKMQIDAYDRCWQVQCSRTDGILHLSAGTPYLDAVQQLLTKAGITMIIKSPSVASLQTDREDWQIGTDYLTICNTLLSEINYNQIWFDVNGFCRLDPIRTPDADQIHHPYGVNDLQRTNPILEDNQMESDLYDKPNVFIVVCSNPDLDAPMVATSINDSPTSATSTVRRGMRIVQVSKVDNIASQSELQEYANMLRLRSMFSDTTIVIHTMAEGGHSLLDTVSLSLQDRDGLYQELDWSITMQAGSLMGHTLRKVAFI